MEGHPNDEKLIGHIRGDKSLENSEVMQISGHLLTCEDCLSRREVLAAELLAAHEK